ncbi:MAG TPA: DUF4387 domain-containing protein [Firmicutes bacterium]|jgi:GTP cyclohydrolase III|nr:DUF4387 domain-containing protein [Bacillota bacterium]HHT42497.1 DUF4387 domain-containing protein [Bacillota bacterium]
MRYVKDVASVIRSKNAGPYELTFDLMFPDAETYDQVRHAITKEKIASLYQIEESQVLSIVHFAPAHAVKITIERPRASGDLGETDVYGAQQHAPLFDLTY